MAQRILALRKNEKNEGLYNDLFKTKDMSIVSSSPKVFSAIHKDDFGDEFHISDAELDAYVEGFIDAVNEANIDTVITEYNKGNIEVQIITGNSHKMKEIVSNALKEINVKFRIGDFVGPNKGYIQTLF